MAPLSGGIKAILAQSVKCIHRNCLRKMSSFNLNFSDEVSEAIRNNSPVVSLESTIITHGMPYPTNLSMARSVEDIVRSNGATPATIAVINGKVHVGLSDGQIEELAEMRKPAVKTSRRDFPYVIANQLNGGTTVSGTMLVSHKAGLDVFVTGGIGGVHRGGEVTMDISADLTELGKTPVCVVCAGVKSILDIGRTLEYLETQGVCVASFGESKEFPAFYTPKSGFFAPYNVNSLEEAASLVYAGSQMKLNGGVLIGVPIPCEEAASGEKIEEAIKVALQEAMNCSIVGREVTPYILGRLNELTKGESLGANLALVKNNAKVGAGISVELARMKNGNFMPVSEHKSFSRCGPLVVGGSIYDFVVRITEGEIILNGGTHGGSVRSSHGGVGRNVASALAKLGQEPRLISAVGEDREGRDIVKEGSEAGVDTQMVIVDKNGSTAAYTAILDSNGDCQFGVGDMGLHGLVTPEYIRSKMKQICCSNLVVCDGNVDERTIDELLKICSIYDIPFFYEPTDIRKATKPLVSSHHSSMTYCSPNLNELISMISLLPFPTQQLSTVSLANVDEQVSIISAAAIQLLKHYKLSVILVTLSECGVVLVRTGQHTSPLPVRGSCNTKHEGISAVWYPCNSPCESVVSVSGAGDCLTAGFIAGVLKGLDQAGAVAAGMQAARLSCSFSAAVPDILHQNIIDWSRKADGVVLVKACW